MPCYQSTSLPSGVTTTGRTSYATEAECNQACKEGACCEGTTCTVKPQCQCQCTSGSCCGPDTFTNSNGETGPRCRNESESACAARGGTWRCGVFCVGLQGDQFAGQPLGSGICTSLAGSPSAPVFKGVGTVCAGNPCVCASTCIPTSVQSLTLTISGYEGQWRPQTITLNGSYSLQRLPSNPCIWYWSGYENTNCSSKQSFASSFWDGTNASGVNHRVGFRLAQNSFAWYMIDTVDLNCCGAYCTDRSGCNYIGFGGNGLVSGTTTPVLDAICSSPVSQVNAAGSVYGAVCGTSFLHYFQWTVAINPLP
jgi:hypothetical protein